ncbi:hypothetical protein C8R46DRAFT_1354188 [Mycena filopes]|nr:hypothetical protein C8R46DRAFT_1354188 [Mycena filopes]
MSARVVLQIPELCEHITTHLGSSTDLRTCALLTKTFTFAAQRRLFHDIILDPRCRTFYELYPSSASASAEDDACRRLCLVLKATPHLLPFVRRLRVTCGAEAAVERLATVQFPNLDEVVFYRGHGGTLEESTLAAMRSIIGLPTIRRVGLLFPRFRNADDFRHIFQLKPHLEFLRCHMFKLQALESKLTDRGAPTTTIKELQIIQSESDAMANSFDFSRLEKLECDVRLLAHSDAEVLVLSRSTLTCLKIGARNGFYDFRPPYHTHPLSGLSALRSLHIVSDVNNSKDITMALTQISSTPNCLETVTLTLLHFDQQDTPTRLSSLHDLASRVVSLPLQALRRLDICLGRISGNDKDEIPREVETAFSLFPASVKVSVIPWTHASE